MSARRASKSGCTTQADIPWSQIAFLSVEFALRRYLDDRKLGVERLHFRDIDYHDGKVILRDR